jgi:hypothetical protein
MFLSQSGQMWLLVAPLSPQKAQIVAGLDMTEKKLDPTQDPKFQKVVQAFLRTKPQPHKAGAPKPAKKRASPKRESRKKA